MEHGRLLQLYDGIAEYPGIVRPERHDQEGARRLLSKLFEK